MLKSGALQTNYRNLKHIIGDLTVYTMVLVYFLDLTGFVD